MECFDENSVSRLCEKIYTTEATIIPFVACIYRKDHSKLWKKIISHNAMTAEMLSAYHEGTEHESALIADIGLDF